MNEQEVNSSLVDAIDFEPLNAKGIYFGQYLARGFTLEQGEKKFVVTVVEA